MSNSDDLLIVRLTERCHDPQRFIDVPEAFPHRVYPQVSHEEMAEAEHRLGFQLPPLLRRIYLEIGNGGFGPGFGLLALNEHGAKNFHLNLVDWYLEGANFKHPDYPPWPREYLTICDWGDGITSMLDWTSSASSVYRFNGDLYDSGPFEAAMRLEADSIREWLERWLDGTLPLTQRPE